MDMMHEFGAMAFASRLKRLGDRLKSEATRIYRANGIHFSDRWFLLALILSDRETVSVTGVANAFGISHSAVSQMVTSMERQGLLTAHADERDRRRTLLCLTEEGRTAVEALRPLWNAVGEITSELIESTGRDLLAGISEIERQLEQKDLFTRVSERMKTGDH